MSDSNKRTEILSRGIVREHLHNTSSRLNVLEEDDDFKSGVMDILSMVAALPPHIEQNQTIALYSEFKQKLTSLESKSIDSINLTSSRYYLCCLIDEKVMKTPWGQLSPWANQSLLSLFFNETHGGERFFAFVQKCVQQPQKYRSALEVAGYCLSFGFMGQYYYDTNGKQKLNEIRAEVYRWLVLDDSNKRAMFANYPTKKQPNTDPERIVPLFTIWLSAFLILVACYCVWLFFTSDIQERFYQRIYTWAPKHSLQISNKQPENTAILGPELMETPTDLRSLSHLLESEIDDGQYSYSQQGNTETVILSGNLFASGSARINTSYDSRVKLLAEKIVELESEIEVVGHTDNVPIKTVSYPSNLALSEARANEFAKRLISYGVDQEKISVSAKGDAKPLVANDTRENRAINRRIEVKRLLSY